MFMNILLLAQWNSIYEFLNKQCLEAHLNRLQKSYNKSGTDF
jgi:hypothetical protein